jgi:release factor glutamine methyltransferase
MLGLKLLIDDEVFNPDIFFSSKWFAENIARFTSHKKSFLEVGCGTGIISLYCAKQNVNLNVYATDINPRASKLTKSNSELNRIDGVHVYHGDVFDGIPSETKADVIFWSMPFGYLDESEVLNNNDWQVFDPGYRAIRKFFEEAREYLNENGKILFGFSVDVGHFDLIQDIAIENNFELTLINKTNGIEKEDVSMEIWEAY